MKKTSRNLIGSVIIVLIILIGIIISSVMPAIEPVTKNTETESDTNSSENISTESEAISSEETDTGLVDMSNVLYLPEEYVGVFVEVTIEDGECKLAYETQNRIPTAGKTAYAVRLQIDSITHRLEEEQTIVDAEVDEIISKKYADRIEELTERYKSELDQCEEYLEIMSEHTVLFEEKMQAIKNERYGKTALEYIASQGIKVERIVTRGEESYVAYINETQCSQLMNNMPKDADYFILIHLCRQSYIEKAQ